MKTIFLYLLTFVTFFANAQKVDESIESKKLGETRKFTVTLPANYEFDTDKKYPTLLVLDGEYLTSTFDGILKYGNYWDDLPEMIIISVNQNYKEQRFVDSEFDKNGVPSGKGALFFEFIGFELLPFVESKYRTQPFRIIAGHDTTAGFLNFFLYKDKPIFNAYISLAPEMAPFMEKRIAERLAALETPIMYYHASGKSDIMELREKSKSLDQNIQLIPNRKFRYQFDEIPNASHYSIVPLAIPKALYFIFNGYQPISMIEFQEKIMILDKGYTQYLIDKYDNLEKNLGLVVKPRLTDFKAIEAAILKNKAYLELQELSKYAEKHYPKTTLGVYHQAMYYEKMGEYKKAVKEYRKAFSREELKEVRELTKDYMLNRAEDLNKKKDESIVEEFVEPAEDKKEGE